MYLIKVCTVEHLLGDPGLGVGAGFQTATAPSTSDPVSGCVQPNTASVLNGYTTNK